MTVTSLDDLKGLNYHEYVTYECQYDGCHEIVTKQVRSVLMRPKLLCRKHLVETDTTPESKRLSREKCKQTCLEKYGKTSNLEIEEVVKKRWADRKTKYGNSGHDVEKRRATCTSRYGGPSPACSPEISKKQQETRKKTLDKKREIRIRLRNEQKALKDLEKEKKQKSKEIKKVISCLKKYLFDVDPVLKSSKVENTRLKTKRTLFEKYSVAVSSPMGVPSIREKARESFKSRYGVDNYMQTETFDEIRKKNHGDDDLKLENREKARLTCLKKYGVPHHSQDPAIHERMLRRNTMTKPEKVFFEGLEHLGITFVYQEYLKTIRSISVPIETVNSIRSWT